MKLDKRMLAFTLGATALLVAIVALPSRHEGGSSAPPSAQPPQGSSSSSDASATGAVLLEQRQRAQQLTWGRNPFVPAAARSHAAPPSTTSPPELLHSASGPQLSGVSICGDDRRAVIDREIVREGERLASGYTVGKITARSVTLLRDQEELTLSLGDEE